MKIKKFVNENIFKINKLRLLPEEIHIWCIKWELLTAFILKNWNMMNEFEKRKIDGFKFYEDKMRCATGKILTKLLLSRYLNLDNTKIEIYHGMYGKPYLKQIGKVPLLQFNLSGSNSPQLCCVTNFFK